MPRFDACDPSSQKCVSTLNDDGYPAFDPVPFDCSPEDALAALRRTIATHPRTEVVDEQGMWIDAICTTKLLRFKDRVQGEVDADARVVHLKSYSTLSWAQDDLNANRDRLEELATSLRRALPTG